MDLAQITNDLGYFIPELFLTFVILVATIHDLFLRPEKTSRIGNVAMAGLGITLVLMWMRGPQEPRGLFANMLAFDQFGYFFRWLVTLAAILVIWMSLNSGELKNRRVGEYYILILVLVLGMFFLVSATNLLSIYISLEMVSLMSFLLTGYLKERTRSNESSVKYVIYGAFSSGIMLYGFSLLYGLCGTADLSQIQVILAQSQFPPALMVLIFTLVIVGFGYKIAAVPFHFWTPDVYEGAPTPITGFLSVAPKAAGFAVLIRFVTGTLTIQGDANLATLTALETLNWPLILAGLAALTMTVGNVVAIQQENIKRMLAYSSIAHAGYMLMGVVVADQTGISAILYYAAVYLLMNLGAFAVAIHVENAYGTENIQEYAGLGYRLPLLGVAMTVFMFSLTGIPPTGGFVAKFYLFRALIEVGDQYFWLAILGLINGVVSLYYYMRVVKAMYLTNTEIPETPDRLPLNLSILFILIMLPLLLAWMSGDPLSDLTRQALHFAVN